MASERNVKLKKRIDEMHAIIESQGKLINRSLECLELTKASLVTTRMVKRINGEALTHEEQLFHESQTFEACENASSQMRALGDMQSELRKLEVELLFDE